MQNKFHCSSTLAECLNDWDIPRIQSVVSGEFSCTFQWSWNVPHGSRQNGIVESTIKKPKTKPSQKSSGERI